MKKTATKNNAMTTQTQTPFERFKAAASQVLSFQKSSLFKIPKKANKK